MKLELINQKEDKLLSRKEILFKLYFDKSTPNKEETKKLISETLKCDLDVLVLEKVKQRFGERSADVFAYLYKDKESLKKIEFKNKKLKKEIKKDNNGEEKGKK